MSEFREGTRTLYRKRILEAQIYVQSHLDDPIEARTVAAAGGFSLSHFHRVFKAMMGETLGQYVRRLRLERAAMYIFRQQQRITDAAFDAGYDSVEAFSRAFRAHFHCRPSQFREMKSSFPGSDTNASIFSNQGEHMDVQIKNFDPLEVAFVRHTGPYAKCTWAWNRICSWAESLHLIGPQTLFIGLSHDDPTVTPADKIRYDACITVNGQIQVQDGISLTTIPGGDYAVFLHTGPYENLEAFYRAIYSQWLPTSGRKLRGGTPLEIYLNHADQTAPEELLTEIRIPLEPAV